MGLDIKTLVVADVAVLFVTAAASFLFWRRDHDGDWLLWWACGTATIGIAMSVLGLFGPSPPPAAGLPAAGLFLAGFLMVWGSMRRLNARPVAKRPLVGLMLAFVAVMGLAVIFGADLRQRAGLLMAAMALCAMACAWEAAFGAPTPARTRLALAAIFFVMSALLVATAVLTALWQHPPVASFRDLLGDALPVINSIGTLCLCVFVMLLANERASNRYRELASTDELTGLPNRRSFLEAAGRLIQQARRTGAPVTLLMMDLDHFTGVNKQFGHAGGDQALKAFAEVLRRRMRPGDVVGRYGGEEFCALLMGTEMDEAVRLAEGLREAVAASSVDIAGSSVKVTVSIGIAPLREGGFNAALLDADAALYRAKERGRNQVSAGADDRVQQPSTRKANLRIVR